MRFSQPKREEISLGVSIAPLIDIVFLLLIFFMLTSHFDIISGIDIKLPDISERGSDRAINTIAVALDKKGNCYLQKKKVRRHGLIDLHKMQKEKETCLAILKDLKEKNRLLADEIRRLKEDSKYFESVAREQLGMVKDNEIVYRFKKALKNAKKGNKKEK